MAQGRAKLLADFECFDDGREPIVVGRTPYLPAEVARSVLAASRPFDALQTLLRARPDVMLALYVASPSLHAAAESWLEGRPLKNRKAPLRILAYVVRMATRSTPMGLCAAVGSVASGEQTSLALESIQQWKTRSRVDMGWLGAVAKTVEADRLLRERLTVYPNDLVLRRGGRMYVMSAENTRSTGSRQEAVLEYTPVSLRVTPAVERVRELASDGATLQTLKTELMREFALDGERATRLLDDLWKAGVFISELRPSLIDDPVARFTGRLTNVSPIHADALLRVTVQLQELDDAPIRQRNAGDYACLSEELHHVQPHAGAGMQVDTVCQFAGRLGPEVVREVRIMAGLFFRCARRFSIDEYVTRFLDRYESSERLVPLLELADPNFGLGAPNESDADLHTGGAATERALFDLAASAIRAHQREIVLNDNDLERYLPRRGGDGFPWSFEIGVQVAARSLQAINAGDFLLAPAALVGTYGGGKSIGRFADILGAGTIERLRERTRECRAPDAVFAELVYNPSENGAANVAIRPSLVDYELQVGLRSQEVRKRVALDDVLVGLDNGRFFFYSLSLKKRVIITENHLLNTPYLSPNLCRLLSSAAREGTRGIAGFDWRRARSLPFLPRLRYGRIVLALACWNVEAPFFKPDGKAFVEAVAAWRSRWNVPRYVALIDADNKLCIDLNSQAGLDLLRDQRPNDNDRPVILEEFFPDFDALWLKQEGHAHAAEFIFSFFQPKNRSVLQHAVTPELVAIPQRAQPWRDWVYAKLYCGRNQIDFFLREEIAPWIKALKMHGELHWFFLRYADPAPHIRLRYRARTAGAHDALIEQIDSWLESGVLRDAALATYEREVERYGGAAAMERIETLFTVDSELVLFALGRRTPNTATRLHLCLLSFDPFVRAAYPNDAYVDVLKQVAPQNGSQKVRDADRGIVKAAQNEIAAARTLPLDDDASAPLAALRDLEGGGVLLTPFDTIFSSLMHMHCNRFGVEGPLESRWLNIHRQVYSGLAARQRKSVANS